MTNCTSCGTEIPVKDIVTGNYKKIEGNTYCLPCSAKVAVQSVTPPAKAATASAGAASSSSGSKGVGNGSTATKTKTSSSSSASLQRPAGLRPAASASKPTNSSSSRSGSGIRRPPIEKDEEIDEETPRRGYVKKADPTLKIVSILGGVLLVIALVTVFVVFSRRNAEETERIARFNKSRNAISEIQRFLSDHTEDSSNDELDQLITRNAPFVIEDHTSDLNAAKNQLKDRRDIATKRKEFASLYEFLKANASSADKAEEVKNAIEKAERLIGAVGTPEQTKDFASFKVKSAVAIVESKVLKANELKEKSPDDYPAICAAFTLAEEQMSDQVQQLINTKVPGADRAKELFEQVQTEANHYADLWAESDKYGFGKATAQNLLDPKEFAKVGESGPRWVASPSADYKLEGGTLVVKGLQAKENDFRAGKMNWAPGGKSMSAVPGSKDVIRNYEITMKFKVVRKGFTLLARAGMGYQRHAYDFETAAAQQETKEQNKKAVAQGRKETTGTPAGQSGSGNGDPFAMPGDPQPANQGSETAFTVEDGKTYEVIERVYGHNVEIRAKTIGESSESEPLRDTVRARYGGIGIQVLPGAEVIFDTLTIKVLS